MIADDRAEFGGIVAMLCRSFGKTCDKPMVQGYWLGLEDLPLQSVKAAVARAIRESKFMPRPAELRGLAGEMNGSERAIVAWRALMGAVAQHGPYKTIAFDDPTIHAAVESIGGWERLGELETEQLERHERRRFESAYETFWRTGVEGEPLRGIFDRTNGDRSDPIQIRTGLPRRPGRPSLEAPAAVRQLAANLAPADH